MGVLALSGITASTITTAILIAFVGAVSVVIIIIALKIYKGEIDVEKMDIELGYFKTALKFYPK